MADDDERPQYQHGVGTIGGSQFHWGSGEPGKYWSIPYGDYPVTPNAPTGAWAHSVGAIPIANNVIPDPLLGRNRIGIMIHSGSAPSLDQLYTEGCFKVDPQDWPNVRSQILAEADKGPLYLHVAPGGVAAFTNTKTFSQASDGTPAATANATANTTAAPASSTGSSAAPPGTSLTSNVIDTLSKNIAGIESGGSYSVVNSRTGATGKYQVMPFNVGPWTQQALGHSMTPDEFRANPAAQEAVFRDQASRALATMSPVDFASTWFTGKPYSQSGAGKSDYLGTTNQNYITRATQGIDNAGTFTPAKPGTTINTSGGPPAPAGGPGATPASGQPAPASGGWAGQMASALKPLAGGKGDGQGGDGGDQPQPMQLPQAFPAQAVGGPMMMGPGGQNVMGQRTAQNALAQQGFMMQPTLAANTLGATRPPVPTMMPGQATGIPGLPGTTLNSPSQLQMALMTGAMSPYDLYANNAAQQGGGFPTGSY